LIMFGFASLSAQSYIRILSIHNATRKRESIPSN
jgi:hypothetical protein